MQVMCFTGSNEGEPLLSPRPLDPPQQVAPTFTFPRLILTTVAGAPPGSTFSVCAVLSLLLATAIVLGCN